MERWNLDWNLMRVLLKRTFSEEVESMFYDYEDDKAKESAGDYGHMSVTGKFRTLHQALRGAEKATEADRRTELLDRAEGLDRHSGQGQVLRLVKVLGESGRTLEISYPWKCKLTEGEGRCSKVLPRVTLA